MSEDNSRRDRGEEMFNTVYGGIVPLPPREGRSVFVTHTIEQLFAETWTRDVLSVEQRRLLLIGAVMALGEHSIIEIQMRAALARQELTPEQLEEINVFMVNYVGYPRATGVQAIIRKVIADHQPKG